MAKQASIITLDGSIDNISFFKTKDGYKARKKTGVAASQIASDPKFQRTRENNEEFGRAGKAGKLLRNTLLEVVLGAVDRTTVHRMTAAMLKVIHADAISARGKRNMMDGRPELLEGFEFNIDGPLSNTLLVTYTASIDRLTGECKLALPSFVPEKRVTKAEGATHFKLLIAGASVNFETGETEVQTDETVYLPLNNKPTKALDLQVTLSPDSTAPLFLALTIEFVQEMNDHMYSLKNGAFNACALVKVNGGN